MSSKGKILIADDEIDFVKLTRDWLEFEGYETIAAYEGVRTIEAAHKQAPQLILLDLRMPAGGGQSVLQALRSKPQTEKIPVIVITGEAQAALQQEILALGAQEFIVKPAKKDILLEKIKKHIK